MKQPSHLIQFLATRCPGYRVVLAEYDRVLSAFHQAHAFLYAEGLPVTARDQMHRKILVLLGEASNHYAHALEMYRDQVIALLD